MTAEELRTAYPQWQIRTSPAGGVARWRPRPGLGLIMTGTLAEIEDMLAGWQRIFGESFTCDSTTTPAVQSSFSGSSATK